MDDDELAFLHATAARRWRRRMGWLLPVMAVAVVAGAVVPEWIEGRPVLWPFVAVAAGSVVVLVLVTLGVTLLVLRSRTGRWSPAPLAVGAAPVPARKAAVRAVRRGYLPDDDPGRTLVLELAQRTVAQRWVPWVVAADLLVLSAGAVLQAFAGGSGWIWSVVGLVVLALGGVALVRQRHGARRVLAAAGLGPDPQPRPPARFSS